MTEQELLNLTDEELLIRAKKMKSTAIINAVLVGAMAGIIIYSIINQSISLFTLIPLIFAFKLINDSKKNNVLKKVLKERNLNIS